MSLFTFMCGECDRPARECAEEGHLYEQQIKATGLALAPNQPKREPLPDSVRELLCG